MADSRDPIELDRNLGGIGDLDNDSMLSQMISRRFRRGGYDKRGQYPERMGQR